MSPKSTRLSVNINAETAEFIREVATEDDVSMTEAIRKIAGIAAFVRREIKTGRRVLIEIPQRDTARGDPPMIGTPGIHDGIDELLRRIAARVTVTDTGCWEWTGARTPPGYGKMRVDGKVVYLHRLNYELYVAPLAPGVTVDHLCRNTSCCNPTHLEAVSIQENIRRAAATTTHCPTGHPYDEQNTYLAPRGDRRCRTCAAARYQSHSRAAAQ